MGVSDYFNLLYMCHYVNHLLQHGKKNMKEGLINESWKSKVQKNLLAWNKHSYKKKMSVDAYISKKDKLWKYLWS